MLEKLILVTIAQEEVNKNTAPGVGAPEAAMREVSFDGPTSLSLYTMMGGKASETCKWDG